MSARYEPKRIDLNVPRVDSVHIAQVGDNLLLQGNFSEHDAIYVPSEIGVGTFSELGAGIFSSYTIRPGFYTKEGENEVAEFFRPSTYGNGGANIHDEFPLLLSGYVKLRERPAQTCVAA